MKTKVCSKCSEEKSLDEYYKMKSGKYGVRSICITCFNKQRKEIYRKNPQKEISKASEWKKKNREKVRLYCKNYREGKGKARKAFLEMRRHAKKLNATPEWLTEKDLEEIYFKYEEAAMMTMATGSIHHVDHVVPLQGKTVSGLHVPWNLQVIPAIENQEKKNLFNDW